MNTDILTDSYSIIELNFSAPGSVPEAIEILPRGPVITGRDGRSFRVTDPDALVAAFNAAGQPMVIDIDHASESDTPGTIAPAMGWVETLEVRDGAVWGQVKWTEQGRALMQAQAYRYVSPSIWTHKKTREVSGLSSVALVHKPNLTLKALNSQQENDTMDNAILQALGLEENATLAQAVAAINEMNAAHETALNAARQPDPEVFVPRADYDLVTNQLNAANAAADAALEQEIHAVVDAAIAAGKAAPASRELHLATCRANGVEKFTALMGTAPDRFHVNVETNTQKTDKAAPDATVLEICKLFGTDPETHMAFAAKDKDA